MSARTVRLDDEAERTLAAVRKRTGPPVSEVLRQGLRAYDAAASREAATRPFEAYQRLELGSGSDTVAPAKDAKAAIAEVIAARRRQ